MSFPRYSSYRHSGIDWLGELPEHWSSIRLKCICDAYPSNVDKKSREGEAAISLCNYTDVYYNETITDDIQFMQATASTDQIQKFTLRAGDTIITKDSESADDIAIAAYVAESLPDVVCGYHLSMLRPKEGTSGAYIKRLFDSVYVKSCFAVRANGLTRVGIGQYALDNVELPLPPLSEQQQIATFLDRETAKIDELIAEQQRLIELLKEKRQAVISHAVTKGLNPDAPMKPSDIEWLGDVPCHWRVSRLKHVFDEPVKNGVSPQAPDAGSEGVSTFSIAAVRNGVVDIKSHLKLAAITKDAAEPYWVRPGDVMMMRGNGSQDLVGSVGIIECVPEGGCVYPDILIRLRFSDLMSPEFAVLFLNCPVSRPQIEMGAKTAAGIWKVAGGTVAEFAIPIPPFSEQITILKTLNVELSEIDDLRAEAYRFVELLQERRTALISAAVTGQIDVRGLTDLEAA
ncbi:MAG: hypothetical protein GKR94_16125 [Gammaproteobacteria bacterium]|nr:hypothetical protein [Gammaproteobacteria bacterium]